MTSSGNGVEGDVLSCNQISIEDAENEAEVWRVLNRSRAQVEEVTESGLDEEEGECSELVGMRATSDLSVSQS